MDGPVELKIPAGTQPGTTLLMAKRGVPRLGASNQVRGNHNVSREIGRGDGDCMSTAGLGGGLCLLAVGHCMLVFYEAVSCLITTQ